MSITVAHPVLVALIEPLGLAEAGSVFFTRPHLAGYIATVEEMQSRAQDLSRWHAGGEVQVTVDQVYPLAEAAAANSYFEAGRTQGKLLLPTGPTPL